MTRKLAASGFATSRRQLLVPRSTAPYVWDHRPFGVYPCCLGRLRYLLRLSRPLLGLVGLLFNVTQTCLPRRKFPGKMPLSPRVAVSTQVFRKILLPKTIHRLLTSAVGVGISPPYRPRRSILLGNRLMVGQRTLTPSILVRVQVPQPFFQVINNAFLEQNIALVDSIFQLYLNSSKVIID